MPKLAATITGANRIGKHVPENDPTISRADRLRGDDEFRDSQREKVASDQARDRRPTHRANHEHDVVDARSEDGDNRDDDDQRWKREHHIGEAHDERIDPAAIVPRQTAQHDADRGIDGDGHQPNRERDASGVQQSTEDITTGGIGAEDVRARWPFSVRSKIDGVGITPSDPRAPPARRPPARNSTELPRSARR